MSLSREQMLVEMGISPIWVRRDVPVAPAAEVAASREESTAEPAAARVAAVPPVSPPPLASCATPAGDERASADWPTLARLVAACRACPLGEGRRQAVLGVGDTSPDYLFIGEGPGAEEDVKGEPFVGQAGKLLDNMLAALGLARGSRVYIANAVKCRPPGNRTPEAAEIAACRPFLERQVALLKPKVIVLLGKPAMASVLREDKPLASMRGRRFEYAGIPVVVTYHPAYLLRNLPDKAKAWEDLLFARRILREQGTPELPF